MKKLSTLLTAAALILISSTGCEPDKKIVLPNPYYCTMEINGVPYEIPQQFGIASGMPGYRAGNIGSTEYQISFKRINDFVQTQLKFSFAGSSLPSEDTVINPTGSLFNHHENQTIDIESGNLIFYSKSIDSLSGTFEFDGRLYIAGDAVWIPTDSIVKVRNGKFCIKPTNL